MAAKVDEQAKGTSEAPNEAPEPATRGLVSVTAMVRADELGIHNALIGGIAANKVAVERGMVRGAIAGQQLQIRQAGAGTIITGGTTDIKQGGARGISGGSGSYRAGRQPRRTGAEDRARQGRHRRLGCCAEPRGPGRCAGHLRHSSGIGHCCRWRRLGGRNRGRDAGSQLRQVGSRASDGDDPPCRARRRDEPGHAGGVPVPGGAHPPSPQATPCRRELVRVRARPDPGRPRADRIRNWSRSLGGGRLRR